MRLDLFLKKSRLIKQRSLAKKACENGIVLIGGRPAKPGKTVKPGQQLAIDFPDRYLEVEILKASKGKVSRAEAKSLYRIIKDQSKDFTDF